MELDIASKDYSKRRGLLTREVTLDCAGAIVTEERSNLCLYRLKQKNRGELVNRGLVLDDMGRYSRPGLRLIRRIDNVDEEISLLDSDHGDGYLRPVPGRSQREMIPRSSPYTSSGLKRYRVEEGRNAFW
jgi:hypothetical protein